MKLCFASHNLHKVSELKALLGAEIEMLSLDDLGVAEEIPEPGETLEENAIIKARYVAERFKINCIADDTGLEVAALNGAPGVYSARFAGQPANSARNISKLLDLLKEENNRKARFRTVIALILNNKEYFFEGIVEGKITETLSGTGGFGYDPVFVPEGFDCTFAAMSLTEKNKISHRGRAVQKLVEFIRKT